MTGFLHEALLYDDQDEFLAGTVAFIREGLAAGEPVLVAVSAAGVAALRSALGDAAAAVRFADMAELGANPARIIPAWRDFVAGHRGPVRGIGEPVWPGRGRAELVECHRHEALLNLAFADAAAFRLLCPYDVGGLEPHVIAGAHETHPVVVVHGERRTSGRYGGLKAAAAPFRAPLPEPATPADELAFDRAGLALVRDFVALYAADAGLDGTRTEDLVLAASELAANSVKYGGGEGRLRMWREHGTLLCELRDGGRIEEPLVGRERPRTGQTGGYGLWLVNQLCDLVQVRTLRTGSVVRLHMATS